MFCWFIMEWLLPKSDLDLIESLSLGKQKRTGYIIAFYYPELISQGPLFFCPDEVHNLSPNTSFGVLSPDLKNPAKRIFVSKGIAWAKGRKELSSVFSSTGRLGVARGKAWWGKLRPMGQSPHNSQFGCHSWEAVPQSQSGKPPCYWIIK